MATITGTVQRAYGFMRPHGQEKTTTDTAVEYEQECCFVDVVFASGTYAQADDAAFDPSTVIQNTKRDGKTVTIVAFAPAGVGDENGTIVSANGVGGVSSNTCTTALLQEDLSTERANGAVSATWNKAIPFFVFYKQPVEG